MKKFLALVAVMVPLIGCDQQPYQHHQVAMPKPNVSMIVDGATELREEKLFLVTLEFQKVEFTTDLWKHFENAAATEYRTLIVGERSFAEYQIGRAISAQDDVMGYLFNGRIAQYVVRPTEKKVESQYFWSARSGVQAGISREQYEETLRQLRSSGRHLLTVPFSGVVQTYVLEKPLVEYQFVNRQQLKRYFVTIRVENSTFTLDLTKHIRNAANTHEITIEVPGEVYGETGDLWDPKTSRGSLIAKGHYSQLRGKVVKKWSEVDSRFQSATTTEGQQFVIPK